jgi:kynureninase
MMHSHDLSRFRARFPLLDERLYFATQCLGPMPAEALLDLEEYGRSLLLRKRAISLWVDRMNEMSRLFESLLGAPPDSVALRDSATSAQAAFAAAIAPRGRRNRILLSSQDFHSTRYLWKAQAQRGFEVVELAPRDGAEVTTEQYLEAIDERTAVVEAALVSPRSGALLDARAVIRAAHDRGALVVLDAYQAVGIVPLDVQSLDADVVVGGTHKWLGSGDMGLAFLYVRPALANELVPAYPGWVGHASLLSFGEDYVPAPGARRFQQGSPAMAPIYLARAGVRTAIEIGVESLRARSLELTQRMIDRADAQGLHLRTPRRPEARGGMLCFDLARCAEVESRLAEAGIDVDHRPGAGLRVAPHFCHRDDECDRVIDAIAEAARER